MQAVIMAGGRGSRLRPLTDEIPKPLVKIIDKPVMECAIVNLRRAGITDMAVTTGYRGEMIRDYFGDGGRLGVNLTYFEEREPLGTAGGVKAAKDFVDGDFIVLSADGLCNIDFSDMAEYHKRRDSIATLAVKRLEDARGYGLVSAKDGLITGFVEKPVEKRSGLVNTGIYIFKKDIFDYIREGFCDFSYDVFPSLIGKASVYEGDFFWSDIGTLPDYYYTNYYVCNNTSQFGIVYGF